MTRKFLPALIGGVLVLSCLGAQAVPAGDPALRGYSSVDEFRHQGNYAVDFIQGRLIPAKGNGVAAASGVPDVDGAAQYAAENAVVTIAFFAIVATALAFLAAFAGFSRGRSRREVPPTDAWRGALTEMLEADLRNLDSLTHGFAGR
jgi:hypothetical protein